MKKIDLKILILIFLMIGSLLFADGVSDYTYHQAKQIPILEFDYHNPRNHVSPVAMSLGGVNITNGSDVFGGYDNPALLFKNQKVYLALSFRHDSEEELNFADMLDYSNFLKQNRLSYVGVSAKTFAFSYQTLADVHISSLSGQEQEYYDYKLDAFQASFALLDKKVPNGSLGFGAKYLTGRLIHLVNHGEDATIFNKNTFIDEKVKGFSVDAGGIYKVGRITFAGSLLDVYSQLYWEHFDTDVLVRTWMGGFQYDLSKLQVMYTLKGRLEEETKMTSHFGVNYTPYSSGNEESPQEMALRGGTFWEYTLDEDGNEEKIINYTMGLGYYMGGIKLDFGLVSPEFNWKSNDYLVSLSLSF
ncbi:MAG: hypothetical protein JXR56_03860 [Candidatus Cloacimonetes bacterium]|nr:hypothetical protein [Candidatus Cloacimonadota bacterium]